VLAISKQNFSGGPFSRLFKNAQMQGTLKGWKIGSDEERKIGMK